MNLVYICIILIYQSIITKFSHANPTRLPADGQSREPRDAYQQCRARPGEDL